MYGRLIILFLVPFIIGCAAFKKLEPDPEILAVEGTYIELKDDDDAFELDKGKKYYVEFPAPMQDNFYLLITISEKEDIISGLADRFDDDKGPLSRIVNEAGKDADESAYPVSKNVQKFYWVIERVDRDMDLQMTYRFLPQWRYKFETQYESFQNILAENKVDRLTYENIGGSVSLRNFNYSQALSEIEGKSANLNSLFSQLSSIEKLFPASILNSQDEAYRNYLSLKEDIGIEQTFQKNYASTLRLFEKEQKTRNNTPQFAKAIPEFLDFYSEKEKYASNVISEANRIFGARLDELTPYYEEVVRNKNNFEPVDLEVDDLNALYEAIAVKKTEAYIKLSAFLSDYNKKANAVKSVRKEMDEIRNKTNNNSNWPDNAYFKTQLSGLNQLKSSIPSAGFTQHPQYVNTKCAKLLNSAIYALRSENIRLAEDYKRADGLVGQLNRYANDRSYRQMIQLINRNGDLAFLKNMYKDLDKKSLDSQAGRINSALKQQNWRSAEEGLRTLHLDNDFLNKNVIDGSKRLIVRAMEDTLLAKVERVTGQKVDAFVAEKYTEVNNVEGLYQNPVFEPAWDITFTSGSQGDLARRKQNLRERLKKLKEIEFPAKAVEFLYKDFSSNINNNGVLKARAIVTHGRNYKGSSSKIKNLVAECDPWASKWITKEVQYRKIYAIPTTTNPAGENTYVFRVNLRIPTDARFPAYDVNIKLPKQIAQNAGSSAWYEKMTMNKNILKPEGRFTILSPNSENDYTALITPLQIEKDADSVLEVTFKHNSYKVYEVSLMAQKPILRKN